MTSDRPISITWLGHAATKIEASDGRVILIDPFIENNPVTPEEAKSIDHVDILLISHGHDDNLGESVQLAQRFSPYVISQNELCGYLSSKGVTNCHGGNTGGTQEVDGIRITMVEAIHSSSVQEDGQTVYVGLAVGFVIRFPDGFTVYHAGDTAAFEGMRLIGRVYKPDIALLPIGDYFTMGPEEASEAIRLLGVRNVVPIHYGTFLVLTGTPEALQRACEDVSNLKIIALKPGESVSAPQLV